MTSPVIVDPRDHAVGTVLEHPAGRGKVYRREVGDETVIADSRLDVRWAD